VVADEKIITMASMRPNALLRSIVLSPFGVCFPVRVPHIPYSYG
jgi:hypothetical protein